MCSSQQRFNFGVPTISDEINEWIDKAWAKHQVNLLAFAFDWIDYFFNNEDIWPSSHSKKATNSWRKYDYDYKQKSNLFNLNSLYRKMPKKSFIKGRKAYVMIPLTSKIPLKYAPKKCYTLRNLVPAILSFRR